jgi:hypothetical protein
MLLEVKVQIFEDEMADGWDVVVGSLLKAKEDFAITRFLLPQTMPVVLKRMRKGKGIKRGHKLLSFSLLRPARRRLPL